MPAHDLTDLLDRLTRLDDISLEMLVETESDQFHPLTETEISQFRVRPYEHQLDAINYAVDKKRFLLLDSMGVGKTNEII